MLPLFGIWPTWKWSLRRAKKAMSLGTVCWAAMSSRSPCQAWVKRGSPRALMTQTAAMVPTPPTASWGPPLFSTSAARRGWGKYKRKEGDFVPTYTLNRKPWCIQMFPSIVTWLLFLNADFPDFSGTGLKQTSLHFIFVSSFCSFPQQPSHFLQTYDAGTVIRRPKQCPQLPSLLCDQTSCFASVEPFLLYNWKQSYHWLTLQGCYEDWDVIKPQSCARTDSLK